MSDEVSIARVVRTIIRPANFRPRIVYAQRLELAELLVNMGEEKMRMNNGLRLCADLSSAGKLPLLSRIQGSAESGHAVFRALHRQVDRFGSL